MKQKGINMSDEIKRNHSDIEKRIVTNFHIIPKAVIHLEEERNFE
jgi:hypothetical protein